MNMGMARLVGMSVCGYDGQTCGYVSVWIWTWPNLWVCQCVDMMARLMDMSVCGYDGQTCGYVSVWI